MAHYVMADLHGEGDLFHAMLKKIAFSDVDKLYILGDVVDRGSDGIALLQEIMDIWTLFSDLLIVILSHGARI